MKHIQNLVIAIITLFAICSFDALAANKGGALDMINHKKPAFNLTTGGQPSLKDLQQLAKQGNKVVINLRTMGEFEDFDEKNAVEKLGMEYVSIEVDGADGINIENAKKLDTALDGLKEPTLVHCASSNRVGGLLAYRAFKILNQSVDKSLKFGSSAGMKSTVKKVKQLISKSSK